jgi:N-acetylglucosamine malate deacetylase 1
MSKLKNLLFTKKAYRFLIRDWMNLPDLEAAANVINTLRFNHNLRSVELDKPPGKRILVIAPHIDDETIGPGGSLYKAIKGGSQVEVLFLTSDSNPEDKKIREDEAIYVAEKSGFTVRFLGWNADSIPADSVAVEQFAKAVNDFNPDLLMITFVLDDHDDHRRANEILYKAFSRNLLPPTLDIWAYQVYTAVLANVIIDITSVSEQKKAMIRCYISQMSHRDWANFALGLNAWNSRFLKGRVKAAFAECFFTVPLSEYATLCQKYLGGTEGHVYANKLYKSNS